MTTHPPIQRIDGGRIAYELARVRRELLTMIPLLNVSELAALRGTLADVAMVIDRELAPAMPTDDVPHAAESAQ